MSDKTNTPNEGELVVVSVTTVKQNGCYVKLDEFEGVEGFIFIGEIASGWVKNIRVFVREGQRLICKVMRTRKDGTSLELSLKSVKSSGEELIDAYGGLYTAFEEAAMNEGSLVDAGFEGEWLKTFIEMAVENVIPAFVEIRGVFTLSINGTNGVEVIQKALLAAESLSSVEEEIEVTCHYNGAPEYRIELKAPDFKTAESIWENATKATLDHVLAAGGEATSYRQ